MYLLDNDHVQHPQNIYTTINTTIKHLNALEQIHSLN